MWEFTYPLKSDENNEGEIVYQKLLNKEDPRAEALKLVFKKKEKKILKKENFQKKIHKFCSQFLVMTKLISL